MIRKNCFSRDMNEFFITSFKCEVVDFDQNTGKIEKIDFLKRLDQNEVI